MSSSSPSSTEVQIPSQADWVDRGIVVNPGSSGLSNTRGGSDVNLLNANEIVTFVTRGSNRTIEARTAALTGPTNLSAAIEQYSFSGMSHATVFLDQDPNTWYMYYRGDDNDLRVKTASAS